MPENRANVPVQSVERMFDIVERLQERDGATVTALADDLDVAKSTVHNHLLTMKRRGYVTESEGEYYVGLRFLDHGGHARTRNPGYEQVHAKVRELADESGELCSFVVEQGGKGIIAYQEQGDRAVETQSRVGTYDHLHAIPGGKSILASLEPERTDEIVKRHGLPEVTEQTITDMQALEAELDAVSERGYAVNVEEYLRSLNAISVPIPTANSDVIGAITIVGPSHRLSNEAVERTIADQLLGISNELELNLSYFRR